MCFLGTEETKHGILVGFREREKSDVDLAARFIAQLGDQQLVILTQFSLLGKLGHQGLSTDGGFGSFDESCVGTSAARLCRRRRRRRIGGRLVVADRGCHVDMIRLKRFQPCFIVLDDLCGLAPAFRVGQRSCARTIGAG